jgi:phosphatidylglycerol:prolipoprotein diacylglycerol transferase
MHPIFFKIGPITIHTYGVLVALAFFAGISLAAHEGKRKGIPPEKMLDLGFYILVAAIVGSRILQVAVEYSYYLQHPLEIVMIWKGGLVFYGGFIGAMFTAIWYLNRHSLPMWKVGDSLAPSIALGQAIGRLGCFEAGCCYGAPTDLPWAVTFTHPDSLAVLGVPVHPSQLYESIGAFLIFLGLFLYRKRIQFDGQLFWLYAVCYSVLRFTLEFFRGDTDRGFMHAADFNLSTSQAIALGIFLTSMVMLSKLKTAARRKHKEAEA